MPLLIKGCPNCGPHGAIYCESFRAENKWFIEFYCLHCPRIWTQTTIREVVVNRPSLTEAKAVARKAIMMIKREMQSIPDSHLTVM